MSIFDLYKPFRNKVAQLAYDDSFYVIWAYSQFLQIDGFQIPRDIEVHKRFYDLYPHQKWVSEWELELIAKEIAINGNSVSDRGRNLRDWNTLSDIVNKLKDLENSIYGYYEFENKILIELIRIAHRQFVWQGNPPNSTTTTRYFMIFDNHETDSICQKRLGLTVKDIYLCGMGFMGVFMSHPAINIPFSSEIKQVSPEKLDAFLSFTCRTIQQLKRTLKSEQKFDDRFAYAYNSLRAFPLIRMRFRGKLAITCPLPTLLFWRITGGLYYELLNEPRFSQIFGASFQKYVGRVIERASTDDSLSLLAEVEYGRKKARKKSVDWIIFEDDCAIFLECKSKRLSWTAKSSLRDLDALEDDIETMADAVVQIYKTITDYLDDQYSHFSTVPTRTIYPVIVTLENWHMFGPVMLKMLQDSVIEKLSAAEVEEDIIRQMPYSIWSIDDLEAGIPVINKTGIKDFMDGKINDHEMTRWEWIPYIENRFPDLIPTRLLFEDEYDKIFSEVLAHGPNI